MDIEVDEDGLTCLACGGLVFKSEVTGEWVCLNCSDVDDDEEEEGEG